MFLKSTLTVLFVGLAAATKSFEPDVILPFESVAACGLLQEAVSKPQLINRVRRLLQQTMIALEKRYSSPSSDSPKAVLYNKLRGIVEVQKSKLTYEVQNMWLEAIKEFLKTASGEEDMTLAAQLLAPIIARADGVDRQRLAAKLSNPVGLLVQMNKVMEEKLCNNPISSDFIPYSPTWKPEDWNFLEKIVQGNNKLPNKTPLKCETKESEESVIAAATVAFNVGLQKWEELNILPDVYTQMLKYLNSQLMDSQKEHLLLAAGCLICKSLPYNKAVFEMLALLLTPLIARRDSMFLQSITDDKGVFGELQQYLVYLRDKHLCRMGYTMGTVLSETTMEDIEKVQADEKAVKYTDFVTALIHDQDAIEVHRGHYEQSEKTEKLFKDVENSTITAPKVSIEDEKEANVATESNLISDNSRPAEQKDALKEHPFPCSSDSVEQDISAVRKRLQDMLISVFTVMDKKSSGIQKPLERIVFRNEGKLNLMGYWIEEVGKLVDGPWDWGSQIAAFLMVPIVARAGEGLSVLRKVWLDESTRPSFEEEVRNLRKWLVCNEGNAGGSINKEIALLVKDYYSVAEARASNNFTEGFVKIMVPQLEFNPIPAASPLKSDDNEFKKEPSVELETDVKDVKQVVDKVVVEKPKLPPSLDLSKVKKGENVDVTNERPREEEGKRKKIGHKRSVSAPLSLDKVKNDGSTASNANTGNKKLKNSETGNVKKKTPDATATSDHANEKKTNGRAKMRSLSGPKIEIVGKNLVNA